jgi:hypothetical protein
MVLELGSVVQINNEWSLVGSGILDGFRFGE